jgi:exodeoxyribonuclease (lambda-induced)
MIVHNHAQGTDAWKAARAGVITGSNFKFCRDRLKSGAPSADCLKYARKVARERVTGIPDAGPYETAAMRFGTEQEGVARIEYEVRHGVIVEEAGFITSDCARYGVSVDGLIGRDGGFECKTLVGTDQLFKVLGGDISDYIDQCYGAMWLLEREWWDLVLWAPDLSPIGRDLTVRRILRDDRAIDALELDLIRFKGTVDELEALLRGATATEALSIA